MVTQKDSGTGPRLRVGELAGMTGVTVRTLHHYEEIGLLRPSHRSPAGHRLYAPTDVERLHRIRCLRQLGFSLEEIGGCLDRPGFSLRTVIEMHMERLDAEMELSRKLRNHLGALARALETTGTVSVEEMVRTMDMMERIEKHYSPEQKKKLAERREQIGEERIAQVHHEWGELIALVREQMNKGADPASPGVQALAKRWQGLVEEFTGGDPGIYQSLASLYTKEPQMHTQMGSIPDPGLMEFIARAGAAGNK